MSGPDSLDEDWRLEILSSRPHLRGAAFLFRPYQRYSPDWDHDHCAACFIKLTEPGIGDVNVVHSGYAIAEMPGHRAGYWWVCTLCFDDLSDTMEWRLLSAEP